MAQTTVSIRMDDELKKDFDTICNELGMTMTTAVIMLAKKMSREKRLPFEVSIDPFYSEANMKALHESTDGFVIAEEDLKLRGPGQVSGTMQSGFLTLSIADFERDRDTLVQARYDAFSSLSKH